MYDYLTSAPRLLIVDSHEVSRIGLATVLGANGFAIAETAANSRNALAIAIELQPDVVVMDTNLQDASALETSREILRHSPLCRVLLLSHHYHRDLQIAAQLVGVHGYLEKNTDTQHLIKAINAIAAGETLFKGSTLAAAQAPKLVSDVTTRFWESASPATFALPTVNNLSTQESRVLALVAEGLTNKQIAQQLNLSDKTVKNYLSNIFVKLNLSRRSEAAAWYTRAQLMAPQIRSTATAP